MALIRICKIRSAYPSGDHDGSGTVIQKHYLANHNNIMIKLPRVFSEAEELNGQEPRIPADSSAWEKPRSVLFGLVIATASATLSAIARNSSCWYLPILVV